MNVPHFADWTPSQRRNAALVVLAALVVGARYGIAGAGGAVNAAIPFALVGLLVVLAFI